MGAAVYHLIRGLAKTDPGTPMEIMSNLAPLALAPLTLHPGHGYAPLCEPPDPQLLMCLMPPAQEIHGGAVRLARTLLSRGGTRFAALQVAGEAATSAEAAAVLADALEALGDDYGASLV